MAHTAFASHLCTSFPLGAPHQDAGQAGISYKRWCELVTQGVSSAYGQRVFLEHKLPHIMGL